MTSTEELQALIDFDRWLIRQEEALRKCALLLPNAPADDVYQCIETKLRKGVRLP